MTAIATVQIGVNVGWARDATCPIFRQQFDMWEHFTVTADGATICAGCLERRREHDRDITAFADTVEALNRQDC